MPHLFVVRKRLSRSFCSYMWIVDKDRRLQRFSAIPPWAKARNMEDRKIGDKAAAAKGGAGSASREERLAEALRANLKRRKSAARARKENQRVGAASDQSCADTVGDDGKALAPDEAGAGENPES